MGLLNTLGLKPTAAMAPTAVPPKAPPAKSPEMQSLVTRFQELMGRIKALEARKAPEAADLKKASVAAGNLATSPKGIVAANAALDKVEAQIEDAKLKLADAKPAPDAATDGAVADGKTLASEARQRLKSLEDRGRKAIAADPRNPNAGWLTEVVANSEGRIADLEKRGTPREIDSVRKQLDWLEKSIVNFEADAKGEPRPEDAAVDGKKLAGEARQRLKSLEARGRKALAADPRNPNADWLTDVVSGSEDRIGDLEKRGTKREADSVGDQLDWLEESIVRFEANAADASRAGDAPTGEAPNGDAKVDGKAMAREARQILKQLEARGKKAIAADPRNSNGDWLADVVSDFKGRIVDLQKRGTQRELDDVRKQLDWLEDHVVRFEAAAGTGAKDAEAKPPDSPELKNAKAQYKQVMAEIRKLATAKHPQAQALKKAANDAGNLATSPKGIEQASRALVKVMSDVTRAKAEVAKTQADAKKAKAEAAKAKTEAIKAKLDGDKAQVDAAKAATETFNLTVGGRKLVGVPRDEAMAALRAEVGRLSAELEGGWAYHVDQMNLPNEVPFQAWLTTGVDAIKSFVKGEDAAKIPDLNIWDPVREMMNEVKKAEKKGDVKAIAVLLPRIATAIPKARAKVRKYDEQMQGSAQTGVDAGRVVEDTSASAIGAIAEKQGGKGGKVAAQAAAQGLFQGVEQLTEWMIGSRQHADPGAIAKKIGEEAVGAIFKELVAGQLKEPFKRAFGSYLGKGVSDAALKTMGVSRDAFMTAGQKYFAEFAAKQGAGLIKAAVARLIGAKLPSSPEAMIDAIASELMKGAGKQMIVDGVKEVAKAAVTAK